MSNGRSRVRAGAAAGDRAAAMPGSSRAQGVSCGCPVAGHAQRDAAKLARGMVSKWLTAAAGAPPGSCRNGGCRARICIDRLSVSTDATCRPAAHGARAVHQVRPRIRGGRREGRALAAPVARLRKKCRRQVPQVWPNTPGLPCATVGTAYTWSPWCAGLVGHHARRGASSTPPRDTSVGVSGPHDFAVRNEPFVRAAIGHAAIPCAHRIPPPTSRDGRDTPLRRKQDGERYT